jgi:outer membrane protein with beta-barrel domain
VRMNWKRMATVLVAAMLFSAPARAGSFGFYGSYWGSDDAESSVGGGGKVGFQFVKFLELEFHGTYHPSFTTDVGGQALDVEATPVDGGLRVNFLPSGPVNPYVGAGVTYYFLATDQGNIDNKTGIYAQTGLEVGGEARRFFIEALWRKVDTTINLASFNRDTRFDGIAGNVGVAWRWGQ